MHPRILVIIEQHKTNAMPFQGRGGDEFYRDSNYFSSVSAINQALVLKEIGWAHEIVVVLMNSRYHNPTKKVLSKNVDRVLVANTRERSLTSRKARWLSRLVRKEMPRLILFGSTDDPMDPVILPQMLAGMVDMPQAIQVTELTVNENENLDVTTLEEGLYVHSEISCPAIMAINRRATEPRVLAEVRHKPKRGASSESIAFDFLDPKDEHQFGRALR